MSAAAGWQDYEPPKQGDGWEDTPSKKPATAVKAEEPGVLDRADSAITESLQPDVRNMDKGPVSGSAIKEYGKTAGRMLYGGGKAIVGNTLGLIPQAAHALVDEPQADEPGGFDAQSILGRAAYRMAGKPIINAAQEYASGRVTPDAALSVLPEALGQGMGTVVAGKGIEMVAPKVAGAIPARKAIPIAPEEAARGLTKAVNPSVNEWPNYIKANAAEAGNIKAFAEKNKLPLKTQLDWSKAARGAAEEANTYFKEKVLGPHAEESVSTAGAQFKGKNAGEGQRATLGEINGRISAINDELRSAYMKKEAGQTREALASEPELKAEKGALTDILHKELAKRAGMKPEDVAGLRQRFGRMYSVADQTEAAVNQRQSSAGKAGEGRRDVPTTVAGTAADLFNRVVRGGPEGIANRNFRKAIGNTGGIEPTTIPEVRPVPPTMQRGIPAWQLRQRLAERTEQEPTQ